MNEYKSVKGKLDRGKLERENKELREENGILRKILEEHGICFQAAHKTKEREHL